ncbi:MAG: hypothetical protein Q8N84_01130 [bacterium]|nr:hypothetical protein [bacterium]
MSKSDEGRGFLYWLLNTDEPLVAVPMTIIEVLALLSWAVIGGLFGLAKRRPSGAGGG